MISVYPKNTVEISVVLATYNRVELMPRCIDSFLSQTYKNTELIIVDDGSTDNSFELIQKYIQSHQNIRYLRHSNRNVSLSKNAGILAASGSYIAFLDSDDEYKSDYLEKRIQFMQTHPEIDLIESDAIIIGDEYVPDFDHPGQKIHLSQCHIGATFFGKKEVFIQLGGFDPAHNFGADKLLWEQAEQQFRVQKLDHLAYIYHRDAEDSICNSL